MMLTMFATDPFPSVMKVVDSAMSQNALNRREDSTEGHSDP